MLKKKIYSNVKFSPEVISEAAKIICFSLKENDLKCASRIRSVDLTESESWDHDTDEEFFSDSRKNCRSSRYLISANHFKLDTSFWSQFGIIHHSVEVSAPDRKMIEEVFEVFERNIEKCKLPQIPAPLKPKPLIFIGHGGSEQWRDLKDHLHEMHKYEVIAYETGARAGHEIRDILDEMLGKASFAILVMSGEDVAGNGKTRARQNVVHELGLFQGRLGFPRAIALLEDGTEEFSNLSGVQQIRYTKGKIKETFGDVLATLKREFAD